MKAIVIYATITGNNEDVADAVIDFLNAKDVETTKTEISQTDVDDITDYDIAVVVPYTYDKGSIPSEALDFYEDLGDADLSGVVYGVTGSGDTFYGKDFGKAVFTFDTDIEKSGATRGADPLPIHLFPEAEDMPKIESFVNSLVTKATK